MNERLPQWLRVCDLFVPDDAPGSPSKVSRWRANDESQSRHPLVQDTRLVDPIGLKIMRVRSFYQAIFAFCARYMLPLFVDIDESSFFRQRYVPV